MELRRRTPRLELAIVERSRLRLINAVRNGAIDVAVVPGGSIPTDQKRLPVWSERILLLLSEDHPLASQTVVYWTDLRSQTLLLSKHDPGDDIEELLFSKLVAKSERPKVERHDVSRSIVKSLVSMDVGVSLIMESDVGAMLPGLVYKELRDGTGPSRIDFHAFWRTENENVALRRFLELLEERYPTPPSRSLVE
jgi:DNA-binding transcriptional LysR family regulator